MLKVDPSRGLVLMVVNVDAGTMHGQFSFASSAVPRPAASHVKVLFEWQGQSQDKSTRQLPVASSGSGGWSITDFFAGFESHVYVL